MPRILKSAELPQFQVGRPQSPDVFEQPLYDHLAYAAAGQLQLSFFAVPQGGAGKTWADTNMTLAGQIPAQQKQLVRGIAISFVSGVLPSVFGAQADADGLNDAAAVWGSGWLEFHVAGRLVLRDAPIGRFPSTHHLVASSSASDTSTPLAGQLQQLRNAWGTFGGKVRELTVPVTLMPGEQFALTLNWPALVPLPSGVAGRIGVHLLGENYQKG